MGKKIPGWKSTLWLDKIDSWISIGLYQLTRWYRLALLDDLTCLTIIRKKKTSWDDLVNKKSSFVDFVRSCPYTYERTQQFLPPFSAAIKIISLGKSKLQDFKRFYKFYWSHHNRLTTLQYIMKTWLFTIVFSDF